MGEFNVNKTDGSLEQTAGMPSEYPATQVMLSDGVTSVESVLNYSETEHVVGKWIDGSTLYEKTINCGALPNTAPKQVSAGVSNVNVVNIKGVAMATNVSIPLPHVESVLANCVSLLYTSGAIQIGTGMDRSSFVGYVTIRYTKNS